MVSSQATTRRRKIEIKRVEQSNKRHVTFSKRKLGLFNKVTELSILCQAETALIISSQNGKLYACGYPSPDAVIWRFLYGGDSSPPQRNDVRFLKKKQKENVEVQRAQYESAHEALKEEKKRLDETKKERNSDNNGGCLGFSQWWENPIDDMDLEELVKFKESLEQLKTNLIAATDNKINMFQQMMMPSPVAAPSSLIMAPMQTRFSNFNSVLNNNQGGFSAVYQPQQQAYWDWTRNNVINNNGIIASSSSNNLNPLLGRWDSGNNAIMVDVNSNGSSGCSFFS
ncbi:hypothetical protein HN51_014895 [Arachis hypogaea]|uniref:agamous-like MADS-box protein AGL62 n=1 Tax=Arachis hypogaea TaxID=3818 RepID=UPI000DECBDF3|nr:agamous-like MADS-box protein AGL62 [Arachis hypogaea]QHO45068.1 Agamous-like MADS-box protein [Arachis hypogaea]